MIYTSAGVTAGMDLALAMVEEDLGRDCVLRVARQLVMFLKRPGGQQQFSSYLAAQISEKSRISAAQTWILDHLSESFSIAHLAEHVGMSPRNFARVFAKEARMTPAKFIERCRVERARLALDDNSQEPIEVIARRVGFDSSETMRRAFLKHFSVAPQSYRLRFGRLEAEQNQPA
jgi:transcriptional regulator GlxA family with amidase domain